MRLDLVFLSGRSPFGGVFWGVCDLIMIFGSFSDNGWGCVDLLLVVWHRVSSTVGCCSLSETGSWHWDGDLCEIFAIWYYMELGGLLWTNVLNLALPPQRHSPDAWLEHQEPVIHMAQNKRERGGASWRQESKMRRPPSSPQRHQKYIYMLNNSYRTSTERWQKTSDHPKGKKLHTYLGTINEKRKKTETKNRDRTCTSGRELWRRKGFHTLGSPFAGGDCRWWRGVLRSHGGEHSIRGLEAKQRDSLTEHWCWEAFTSPRGLSAHPPGWMRARSWGIGFGVWIPGSGLWLAAGTQP